MKLHFGCGNEHLKGYVNCDVSKQVNPDKIVDLEKPLPFEDNSVDEIVINHTLEHINNFIPLMKEMFRINKNGSIIQGKVPLYCSVGAFQDPTHVRFFTPFTFDYFGNNSFSYEVGFGDGYFSIIEIKLKYSFGNSFFKMNWLMNPIINLNHRIYCKLFAWVFPASEMSFKLKVVKK
jgi:SAM-dependent methyltransferase